MELCISVPNGRVLGGADPPLGNDDGLKFRYILCFSLPLCQAVGPISVPFLCNSQCDFPLGLRVGLPLRARCRPPSVPLERFHTSAGRVSCRHPAALCLPSRAPRKEIKIRNGAATQQPGRACFCPLWFSIPSESLVRRHRPKGEGDGLRLKNGEAKQTFCPSR